MLTSGDVIRLDLGVPEGREAGFAHPAVVVTAQRILDAGSSVIHVVPLTTTRRGFATEVEIPPDETNGLMHHSAGQCQHVRAVSARRVEEVLGNVGAAALAQIREVIGAMLDLSV